MDSSEAFSVSWQGNRGVTAHTHKCTRSESMNRPFTHTHACLALRVVEGRVSAVRRVWRMKGEEWSRWLTKVPLLPRLLVKTICVSVISNPWHMARHFDLKRLRGPCREYRYSSSVFCLKAQRKHHKEKHLEIVQMSGYGAVYPGLSWAIALNV